MQTGVGRVARMRAEDRKPSKRVFPLLQNLDLDSVTFSQLQSVGNPISIEDMNEQEMLDLIVVNLARLCCAGEWTGLLEAGGGDSEYSVVLPEDFINTSYVRYVINSYPPWGTGTTTTEAWSSSNNNDKVFYFPWIAAESGVVTEMGIDISSGSSESNDIQVGIYSSVDTTGAPDTLLATGVFDSETAAVVYDTDIGSPSVVKGTQYWIGLTRSTAGIACTFRAIQSTYTPAICTNDSPNMNGNGKMLRLNGSDLTLPASPTLTNLYPNGKPQPAISLKIT